jgi:hypothetical protein
VAPSFIQATLVSPRLDIPFQWELSPGVAKPLTKAETPGNDLWAAVPVRDTSLGWILGTCGGLVSFIVRVI